MSRTMTFIFIGLASFFLIGGMAVAAIFVGRSYLQISEQNTITETPVVVVEETAVATVQATPTIIVTGTAVATQTTVPVTGTAVPTTASGTSTGATACTDSAALVSDVTIPDGSQVTPGTTFVKTWRIKNTGTCTWNAQYSLVFAGGNTLGSLANSFSLDTTVAPGEQADLSVTLVAPTNAGAYQGDWKLQNARGQFFGVGNSSGPFWVNIAVPGGATTTIAGAIYQDWNENGIYDNNEPLMGSREVRLIPGTACHVQQNALAVTTSGADGRFTFKGDYNGSYCVGLVGNDGLDDVASITITTGQVFTNINLKSPVPGGSITGFLWNDYCLTNENGDALDGSCVADGNGDYHADGMIEPTEGYISGVTILLQAGACANNSNVAVSAVTDASGKYHFGNLQAGTYCVSMNAASPENAAKLLPGDWTFPANGIWYQEITLLGPDQAYPVNFGWDYQLQ